MWSEAALYRPVAAAVFAAALVIPCDMAGQTVGTATGSIVGTVTDSTGAVLPGVAITTTGDAMMEQRTAVTNAEGRYRIVALAPGDYNLSFALAGFRTSKVDDVRIGTGFTATLDVVLQMAALNEGVTVPASGGVLDRHSTAVSYRFVARQLLDLPIGRDMTAQVAATPGVDPNGPLAYGTEGQNRPTVEGILVTGIRSTSFRLDDGSFEEVSVATAAQGPNYTTPGVHQQFLSKSGGNQYRGTMFAKHQNSRWQSVNIDESQIGRGANTDDANRVWHEHDINADIGGFIVKNRLWWYSSFRDQDSSERLVSFSAGDHRLGLNSYTGKATYRMWAGNTLTAYGQVGRSHEPNRLHAFTSAVIHETEGSTADERGGGHVWKAEWNSALNDALLFEVRAGQFGAGRDWTPNSTAPRFEDSATLKVTGGNRDWSTGLRRNQLVATVSHFKDGRTGTHHLKGGVEVFRWTDGETWRTGYPGNVLHVLSNGAPREVYLFHTPSHSESGLWTYAVHVADSWSVTDRLTLNLGVRFERNRVFLPAQEHPSGSPTATHFDAVPNLIAWNGVVPRLGAVYNLTRRDATLLKVSYGRYRLPPGLALGSNSNPNSPVWWSRYTWTDGNGSGTWEPGEEIGSPFTRGGVAAESVDSNTKLADANEFTVWLERDLPGGIGFRTGAVFRDARQFFARQTANWPMEAFTVPVTLQDPGPDGQSGNDDDGTSISTFTLPPDLILLRGANVVRNVPGADADYWTWEVAAMRSFRGRWSMTAAFTQTWHRDQAAVYEGQTVRNNLYPLTPSDLINTGAHGSHEFTTWTAKAYGTFVLPLDMRITPMLQHYSGQPFGRTFETRDLGYGRVVVLAEPIGTRRMDHVTTVDLRVEKGIRLRGNRRLAGFVDVLNLLNSNAETRVSWLSGADFLRPLAITPPRTASVGLKFDW